MTLADLNPVAARSLGPIALAAGLGMAALYVLLPRPKAMPRAIGAAVGAAALVLAALFLTRAAGPRVETILFYSFAGLAIVGGAAMITQHNPARAAIAFALVILSTSGLFLLNAAPFLMAGTIIVYAGAIIVTFLFVLMLSQPDGYSDADIRSREPMLATIAGFFLLATLLLVLRKSYDTSELDAVMARAVAARGENSPADVRRSLGDAKEFEQQVDAALAPLAGRANITRTAHDAVDALVADWNKDDLPVLHRRLDALAGAIAQAQRSVGRLQPAEPTPLSPFSGTPANQPPQPVSAENLAGLGRSLFTDYLLAVELGGVLLLVAAVGAIAITHRTPAARRAAP
jgi:NADH-quinone oxidoreductase subunit J